MQAGILYIINIVGWDKYRPWLDGQISLLIGRRWTILATNWMVAEHEAGWFVKFASDWSIDRQRGVGPATCDWGLDTDIR